MNRPGSTLDRIARRESHDGYAPPVRSAYRYDPDKPISPWVSAGLYFGLVALLTLAVFLLMRP